MAEPSVESIEMTLLQQAIVDRYGYDFTQYSRPLFKRRVLNFAKKRGAKTISELLPRVLRDREFFAELLFSLSVSVSEMFKDVEVYRVLREIIIPTLKAQESIHVWHAGCSTGEEVYATAMVFAEEGLIDRTQIYATDINEKALQVARAGEYALDDMNTYAINYRKSGGKKQFSDYYHARHDTAIMNQLLRRNLNFSSHNLASDGSFAGMHLVICHNVLVYFNETLQNRIFDMFAESLVPGGFLCLGTKENLLYSYFNDNFRVIAARERCFQLK